MDTRDGSIFLPEELKKVFAYGSDELIRSIKQMDIPPTEKQLARKPPRVERDEPCPCNSGKTFGECCLKPDLHGSIAP